MEKYTSLNEILEAVYRDEEYANELDWGDAVSWAGQALAKIDAPSLYVEKVTGSSLLTPHISIVGYRGALPVDFESVLPAGIRDSSTKEVYDHSTDSFHTSQYINQEEPYYTTGRKTFILKNEYIETSEETATIEMAYRAFMVDDDGFPMIPDTERVKEAVRSFITYKMDHRLWRKDRISERVYRNSEQEWLFYIASAKNKLRIMNPERREIWTRHWTRLLPVISSRDYSYTYLGNREDLNIGFK